VQTAQLPGSGAVTSTAPGAGGLGGIIANGSITPAMLNQGITVKTLGGNRITISASAPANPDTNDIWIASATGLISQWNGTIWAPFKFDASVTVLPGTVVAANIATATLTASLIAAGQVYAGFVDSTTVQALQFIASGTQGELLAYAGTPGASTLATVISGRAGTDPYGTAFAEGVEVKQGGLILDNQGSAPAAVSGASSLYSSVAGRLRYLTSAGADAAVDRSNINIAQFTVGNTATRTLIGAPLSYIGGEASQSSEYAIEIDGIITYGTVNTTTTLDFDLGLDGTAFGGAFTIGAAYLVTAATFAFNLKFRLAILTSGAGGTAFIAVNGALYRQGVNVNAGIGEPVVANSGGITKAIDTTASHTIQPYAKWSATNTSESITTYRTRVSRRM
jgi:hypothetical protein